MGGFDLAKHYFEERKELYAQLLKEHNPTDEEKDCLEWIFDHVSNKYFDVLLSMLYPKKEHNERGAGRKRKNLPVPAVMIKMRKDSGESLSDIAKSYEMSRSTLYKLLKEDSEG